MTRNYTSILFITLIMTSSMFAFSATPTNEEDFAYDTPSFTSYGFGYIKVKHVATEKAFYIISENVVTHCCGDIGQLNRLVLSLNNEGSKFISTWLQDPLEDYVLVPSFSNCLQTETEAEKIRLKKIELFKQLGSKVYEAEMKLPLEGGCE